MSWSRPAYDVKAYEQSLKESQGLELIIMELQ